MEFDKHETSQTERSRHPWKLHLSPGVRNSHDEVTSPMMRQNVSIAMGHSDLVSWEHDGGRIVKVHKFGEHGKLEITGRWSWALDMDGWAVFHTNAGLSWLDWGLRLPGNYIRLNVAKPHKLQLGAGFRKGRSPGCLRVVSRSLIPSPSTSLLSLQIIEIFTLTQD